ncbi:hypothetical protein DSOUD_1811 [Desulfuromonas soudanensis]|uniref:Uncharacterized protein n=1 Tax=Desulfuromonas soudanensis TaxID=1603606 RepID=A0A0M5IRK1_9BACT|nr:hypothetical protein [Desulfuromonas soudanensis]ALC16586.1 hypothetical protein DSOUD_1811 [Desulfuromonas soudanensis]
MSHPLYGLQKAADKSAEAAEIWLRQNLPRLRQRDILRTVNGDCSCPTCHDKQFGAFSAAKKCLGEERFQKIIGETLKGLSVLSIHNSEVALVFSLWLQGADPDKKISPLFPEIEPCLSIVKNLPGDVRKKLLNDPTFKHFVKDSESIVGALAFFRLSADRIETSKRGFSYSPAIKWLNSYVAQLQTARPDVDRSLPFQERWHLFVGGNPYQGIRDYFSLPEDREALQAILSAHPAAAKIVESIPEGKVMWKRLKKNLLEKLAGS